MKRPIAVAATLVVIALGLPASQVAVAGAKATCAKAQHSGGEWRSLPGTLDGSRNQRAENKIGTAEAITLQPAWSFSADEATADESAEGAVNEITAYPVIADGCVFAASSTGQETEGWVFALNADTGELVWKTHMSHGVYSSVAVDDGRVFAFVSRHGAGKKKGIGPYVAALDESTGEVLWKTTVDTQRGSDAVSSPVVYKGMVWVGVSGTAAEGDEADRFGFEGNFVLLDKKTGALIKKTFTIPKKLWKKGYAGGSIWSTMAVDKDTDYGYVGTGNPFNYDAEHKHTNAVLKIDLDRDRATFGKIVGSYKGDVEEYFPDASGNVPCPDDDQLEPFLGGLECGRLDVDFGATPNIFKVDGRKLVGAGQKSGVYHVFDAKTMKPVWKSLVGIPSAVGGIVGSTAYDGKNIYGPHTVGGYMWSVEKTAGTARWVSPYGDGVHWGPPATYANGVVYSVDFKGNLVGMDSTTGAQILNYPMLPETAPEHLPISWGGVSVARNTVYASVGVGLTSAGFGSVPGGYVIAFRPLI